MFYLYCLCIKPKGALKENNAKQISKDVRTWWDRAREM